jgi:hypothetical protein
MIKMSQGFVVPIYAVFIAGLVVIAGVTFFIFEKVHSVKSTVVPKTTKVEQVTTSTVPSSLPIKNNVTTHATNTTNSTYTFNSISLSPKTGKIGQIITIIGSDLSKVDNTVIIKRQGTFSVGNVPHLISFDGTRLEFAIPSILRPMCSFDGTNCPYATIATDPGKYEISVKTPKGITSTAILTVVK